MNKHTFPPGIWFALIIMLMSTTLLSNDFGLKPSSKDIKSKVESLASNINIKYTEEVEDRINFLIGRNKGTSEIMLGRATLFFPLIEGVFTELNIPLEFKYIAVIESGLNPEASSRASAVGLWQFMKGTANHVGLKVTKAVDERKDPIKSTYAAAHYLQHLYSLYGDWTLALAAYNCGQGNVNKAIKKADGKLDYWAIQKYLPNETQKYVPKYIAMQYMMSYYFDHDIWPAPVDEDLRYIASVKVFEKLDLIDVARDFNLDFDLVKKLNPAYLKNFIPESDGLNYLTLPESAVYEYINRKSQYENLFHVHHLPKKSEKNLPLDEDNIVEAVVESPVIVAPTRTILEEPESIESIDHAYTNNEALDIEMTPTSYKLVKLKRGQSLNDIAIEYDMVLEDLLASNDIDENNLPKYGDFIKITE